jgi:hypothetical protein
MLEYFRTTLVLGFLPALRTFSPLAPPAITPASANGIVPRRD